MVMPVATVCFWCNRMRKMVVAFQLIFDDFGRNGSG